MQNVAWPSTMVQIEKSMPMMLKAERSEMPVMMPGSAIGSTNSKRDRLAAEEPRPRQRRGGERAEDQRDQRRDRRDLQRQIERRPDIGPLRPGDAEPFRRVARRRKLIALLLGGEGIKDDQRQAADAETEARRWPRCASPGASSRFGSEDIERSHALGHPQINDP